MASNNEERRRRIAERGSDRMALITGRINALPPTPPSSTSSPTYRHPARHAQSLSVFAFDSNSDNDNNNQNQLPPRHARPHSVASTAFSVEYNDDHTGRGEDKTDTSNPFARLKHQTGFKYSNLNNFVPEMDVEHLLEDSDTISEANNHQVSEADGDKIKSFSVTSSAKDAAVAPLPPLHTQQPKKPGRHRHTFFSSRELNSCILASEKIRALSSLTIALLVVFYYMVSESILGSRPLYMVLLTDITIVVARLQLGKAGVLEEETGGEKVEGHGDAQSWGDAVKLMERGLVAYQALRGIFIDCSIYLVVVVCAISFM
ncbi:hypothetical protein SESBI_08432 [Sesbania bispinosa]|nr:hypothetical protein SESBI_08432 [Sesbania bispinosa]